MPQERQGVPKCRAGKGGEKGDGEIDGDECPGHDVGPAVDPTAELRTCLADRAAAVTYTLRALEADRCTDHAVGTNGAITPRTANVGLTPRMAITGWGDLVGRAGLVACHRRLSAHYASRRSTRIESTTTSSSGRSMAPVA